MTWPTSTLDKMAVELAAAEAELAEAADDHARFMANEALGALTKPQDGALVRQPHRGARQR